MKKKIDKICSKMFTKEDFDITKESIDELEQNGVSVIICHQKSCQMKLLSYDKIPLSTIVPILGDFGFVTISEITYSLELSTKEIFVTKILIDAKGEGLLVAHEQNIKEILKRAIKGEIASSPIFGLVYYEDFSYRELMLFRSLIIYINELVAQLSIRPIELCLVNYHKVSRALLEFFKKSFDPTLKSRDLALDVVKESLYEQMKLVEGVNDDRVVKLFYGVLNAIVRTNYFLDKDTISYKLDLSSIKSHLRDIQPTIEMSVYGGDFAGVHLRVSKVARGGIRWSNRVEGFRDEIKSLMATQEAKNAVIVPSGAKGGFAIFKENVSKEEFGQIYRRYIDSLLDLVDNPNTLPPMVEQIVKKDEDDSYFVVAADRGTASMSDTANGIAKERGYWLGDAFASGSSSGYHHKKLGVTAKGALEATRRFFIEMGVDLYNDVVTVVGVGSMSGDVFGNGMLKSQNFKLLGAISHDEVFIDPDPNLKVAYDERKRLFELKRSKWSDYDQSKISEGGGVFRRNAKAVKLSPQIKEILGIESDIVSGEELASRLLQMRVDMLYFGGIGTYVKASWQSNMSLGDKENEFVRIDADRLRAKTVCEGANLALTMDARIEYALNGGRINLDSIDNAAGVNTSDHEVNFKILLHSVMQDGKIDEKQRVKLVKSQSDFVLERVLQTNYRQSLSILLDEIRSRKDMEKFKGVISVLEQNLEEFKRRYFSIPKEHNFGEIIDSSGSIIRPVLATLTLYAKIFLERFLVSQKALDRSFYERYLLWYFPDEFVEQYREYILSLFLRREIIAMVVANKIIDQAGISFIADFQNGDGEHFLEKVEQYLQEELLNATDKKREKIYAKEGSEDIYRLYGKLLEIEDGLGLK